MVVADEAAVEDVGGPGRVGAVVGGEEEGEAGDFFGGAHAAERDVGEERVELGFVVHHLGVDGSGDGAGGDVVDSDAEGAELDGEVSHEHSHAALEAQWSKWTMSSWTELMLMMRRIWRRGVGGRRPG